MWVSKYYKSLSALARYRQDKRIGPNKENSILEGKRIRQGNPT